MTADDLERLASAVLAELDGGPTTPSDLRAAALSAGVPVELEAAVVAEVRRQLAASRGAVGKIIGEIGAGKSVTSPTPDPASLGGREVWPAPSDPMAVARRFADRYRTDDGTATLRHWRGGWIRWERGRWREVEEAAIRASLYATLERAVFVEGVVPVPKPWSPTRYKLADAMAALAAVAYLPETTEAPCWLDETDDDPPAGEVISVRNGLLHVTTRTVLPHTPRFFTEVSVPLDYTPAAPEPVRWLRFLGDLWPDDPEAADVLAEFFGYVLSGRTDQQRILLVVGPTRAGKGVITRVLTELVGGRRNVAAPTLAALGTNFGLSPLIGRTLAVVSDARLGGVNVHQVLERLLSVSGEDTLTVDRKYREPWTGKLGTRFVVVTNELPRFGDASGAIVGRFVILTLSRSWLGAEDPGLTADLLGELDGILAWALDGLDRLVARGRFIDPASSRDAVALLHTLASPTGAFVRECCTVAVGAEVRKDVLYAAYKEWCEANGIRAAGSNVFGRDLRSVAPGVTERRLRDGDNRIQVYAGIALGENNGDRSLTIPGRDSEADLVRDSGQGSLTENSQVRGGGQGWSGIPSIVTPTPSPGQGSDPGIPDRPGPNGPRGPNGPVDFDVDDVLERTAQRMAADLGLSVAEARRRIEEGRR